MTVFGSKGGVQARTQSRIVTSRSPDPDVCPIATVNLSRPPPVEASTKPQYRTPSFGNRSCVAMSTHAIKASGSRKVLIPARNSPRTSLRYASGSSCPVGFDGLKKFTLQQEELEAYSALARGEALPAKQDR